MAASVTVRAIGPAVSCVWAIGMIPLREISPSVGLMPTTPFVTAGQIMDPLVSVPTAATARLADTATPDPELDPQGFWSRKYGLFVCPPRPDQPLIDFVERKFAHS